MIEDKFLNSFENYSDTLINHGVRVAKFSIDKEDCEKYGITPNQTEREILAHLCRLGYKDKGIGKLENKQEYVDRVKYELETLDSLGFTRYILSVWDLINWCVKEKIPTGPGRGSAAGSLVLYLLGVTKLDPVKYGLIFERFVNPTRAKSKIVDGELYLDGGSIADIDLDISYSQREKVIKDYLLKKYPDRVCKILTLNSFTSKLCIKEVGKAFAGHSEGEMNAVTKNINIVFGKPDSIKVCLEGDEKEEKKPNEEFLAWANDNKEAVRVAQKIENLVKNYGAHASGYIVSYDPLDEVMPYQLTDKDEKISGYDMNFALSIAPKLDLLGLKCLDIIQNTIDDINKFGEEFSLNSIDVEDPFIYEQIKTLKQPFRIFQLEAGVGLKTLNEVKPTQFDHISGVLALARPGSLQFVKQYAKYVNEGEYESVSKELDPYLKKTGGVLLYQETLMEIAHKLFGLSLAEADDLRKGVGKKKKEIIDEFEVKIYNQAEKLGIPKETADKYWEIVKASANYSFNRSHSASYSVLTAYTIYLKFKYPQFFLKNCLVMSKNEQKPQECIGKIIRELPHFGIEILPPSLRKKNIDFEVEGKDIRVGLSSIKGVSDKALEKLSDFNINEDSDKFSLFNAANEAGLNITVLSSLIFAGCMDDFIKGKEDGSRAKLVLEAKCWNKFTDREKVELVKIGSEYDYDVTKIILALKEGSILDKSGKPLMKIEGTEKRKPRIQTFLDSVEEFKQEYIYAREHQDLINYLKENEILGFSFSSKLSDIYHSRYNNLSSIEDSIKSFEEGDHHNCMFVGLITGFQERKSKKGKQYIWLTISDETADATCMAFSGGEDHDNVIKKIIETNDGLPKKGDIVVIKGEFKSEDLIFLDNLRILHRVEGK